MKDVYAKSEWLKPSLIIIRVSQTENTTCIDTNKPQTGGDGGGTQCS
jgi:hypothetical protein